MSTLISILWVLFWFSSGYFIGVLHTKYRKYNPKPTTDEPDWGAGL